MSGTVRSGSTWSATATADMARLSIVTCSLLALGVLLLISGCTVAPTAPTGQRNADPAGYTGGSSLPEPYPMPEVSLTDTSGRPYNLSTTPSKPVTLLFFGYTHCPDVCIAVLSDVSLALQRLAPADRDQIQMVFVTTDPARDQEKQIRRYLDRFNPPSWASPAQCRPSSAPPAMLGSRLRA